jgi:hypothetical protein
MKRESLALAVICLMFGFFSLSTQAQVSFFQPPTYAGSGTVFVADFNGDGKPDILTSDGTMNLGNGDGTFRPGTSVSVSSGQVLAVADFNGDGKADVLEQGTGTLLVLLGNGDGTFQTAISTASGASLSVVAAADLNGDSKADVVGVFGSSLVVYISKGDGTFASGVSYSLGVAGGGALLSFGDFNNDTKADVVVSLPGSAGAGFEVLFLGNGDGTLQTEKTSTGLYDPQYATVGDFNSDGNLDLAISGCNATSCTANTVYILAGNGNGTFQAPVSAFSGSGPIAAADVNGDHKWDLVLLSSDDPATSQIYLGNGDGTFSGPENYGISIGYAYPTIAIADFNGDGNLDIAAGGVMLGNGDGTFRGIALGVAPDPPTAAVVGDFEKKGAFDVAMLSYQGGNLSNSVYILSNNGSGALSLIHTYALPQIGYAVATGDFNGDGKLDLLVVGTDPTTQDWSYSVLLGNGDGSFQSPVYYPQSAAGGGAVVVADFNNDQKLDLAVPAGDQSVAILLGNGDGTFAPAVYYYNAGFRSLVVADFNDDGKLDIAAGGTNPSSPFNPETGILYGNGDGTFQSMVFPTSLNACAVGFGADFNNDGNPDLFCGNQVALGNGDGTFNLLPPLSFENGFLSFSVSAVADFNGDGKLDLLGTASNDHPEQTEVVLGNGDGTFGSLINVTTNGVMGFPALIADMNGDGQPDIVFPWLDINGLCDPSFCIGSPTGVGVLLNTTHAVSPQPDFQVFSSGLSPTPITPGQSATSTVTVVPLHGFNANVALSCTGLPTGISCSFNPASIPGGSGTSTLTVTTASSLSPTNSYTVVVSGVSGSLSHTETLPLLVVPAGAPEFQISATPPATVAPGSSTTSTVTVTGLNGFSSAVALTCSSGSGVTCSLNPTSVTPSGSTNPTSTLTINTTTSVAVGTYSVTLFGSSEGELLSIGLTLSVQVLPPGFTLGAASGSSTSQTVSAGQTASFSVAMAPTGGFTGTVNFTCAITPTVTPAPTCSVPSSVQITGSGTQTVAVQVGTTAPVTTGFVPPASFPTGPMPLIWTLTLLASGWLLTRNRKRRLVLTAPVMVLALAFSVGCGGSGSSSHTTPGTPAGTYTATVTATSGSVSQNMALTVVVQ